MNGKRAKQLRKLAGYHPQNEPVLEDIPMRTVIVKRFHRDGSIEDVNKTRTMRINKSKQTYNRWKKAYYLTKQQGGL